MSMPIAGFLKSVVDYGKTLWRASTMSSAHPADPPGSQTIQGVLPTFFAKVVASMYPAENRPSPTKWTS
jgi:hypothetical protein